MALDGNEEVGECSGSHEDDVLARSGFVGVVRIALIFSGKRMYLCSPIPYYLRLQGKGHGAP